MLVIAVWLFVLLPCSMVADIGDAVDAPSLAWSTGGGASWVSQTAITQDGVDAAESGTIIDNEQTSVQTSVNGPGVLVFWWKVSSELDYDFLKFYTNGVVMVDPLSFEDLALSGETPWLREVIELPPGALTVRWAYEKDISDTGGVDRGWLDQVQFYTDNIPPIIPVQPEQSVTTGEGEPASFQISVLGTEPLDYQWRHEGSELASGGRISGAQTGHLTISPVTAADIGQYSVAISNAYGSITSNPTLLYTFGQVLDSSDLVWTHGGNTGWQGQTNNTHDGVDAVISGPLDNKQTNWIRAAAYGPGTLSFWWKVDSEAGAPLSGDGLTFLLDNASPIYLSGTGIDWTNQVVTIDEGPHTVEWQYTKDFSQADGQDRGWVDQVIYIPHGPPPFSLSSSGFIGGAFQVTLQGEADQTYRLYSSSNLLDWVPVQTNSDPSGVVPFADFSAGGQSKRYYRAETDSE